MCRQTLNTHLTLTASWNASSSQSRSLCVNSLTSCYKRGTNCSKLDAILYSGKQRFAIKPTIKDSTPMTQSPFWEPNLHRHRNGSQRLETNCRALMRSDHARPGRSGALQSWPHLCVTDTQAPAPIRHF